MPVTDDIVAFFEHVGTDVVFGLPSEQLEPYYASLADSDVRHVLGRSEAGAAIMADGYARKSGQIGVIDGVGGPGATNTAVGLIEADGASSPVVALTGDNSRAFRGKEAIQDANNGEILDPFVSSSSDPESPARAVKAVKNAFRESVSGVPGPTHVNLAEDVVDAAVDGDADFEMTKGSLESVPLTYPAERPRPDPEDVTDVLELVAAADRPVIVAGEGAVRSRAFTAVSEFAESMHVPVVTSMNAKGIVDETVDYALGVAGRWGYTDPANDALAAADLVLAFGARLGELTTNRWQVIDDDAAIVQVDLDPHWLGRTYDLDVSIMADVRATVVDLLEKASGPDTVSVDAGTDRDDRIDRIDRLAESYAEWRDDHADRLSSDSSPVAPERLVHELQSALPPTSVVVSATSFPGFFTGAFYEVREPGVRYVQARGSDGINYALPQGIGIQLDAPAEPVVVTTGDGGIGYHIAELETAAREDVPITVIVFNNQSLRSSKMSQIGGYNVDLSTDFHPETNYAMVAEGFGCDGHRIETPDELAEALPAAIESSRPVLLDVQVDPYALPPVQLD